MAAETSAGSARPQQPWLHELAICVDGNATALSARSGVMGGRGTGLFVDDRRVLSVLSATLGDDETVPVVSSARGAEASFWGSARRHGNPGADPTVEVLSERTVRRSGMTERVSIVNRADEAVVDRLFLRLGGDGAALHDVKTGLPRGTLLAPSVSEDARVVNWGDDRHDVRVVASASASSVDVAEDGTVTLGFDVAVPRGERVEVSLEVDTARVRSSAFDAGPGSHLVRWDGARVTASDTRLTETFETAFTDLRHLLMTDPQAPEDVFAGAGTPWYLTLFGRDSLWAARLTLPFGTELAAGTLRALARRQGDSENAPNAEAPGKILHEVRREVFDDGEAGLHLPTVYYGSVDATALWIILLHDAWRHGMPRDSVAALVPNLERAVAWVREAIDSSDDGLLRYVDEAGTGLANQGWKDSGDSMRRSDGSVAPAPIALIEAQAYVVEAAHGAAALYDAFGLVGSEELRAFAGALADRVRRTYWVDAGPRAYPAMALDGDGALVDGIGSNMGHVLGTGTFDSQEAARVVEVLTGDDMFGRYGINTLSRSNPAYNPIGYHSGSVWTHDTAICAVGMSREGHRDEAARVARALVEASASFDYRWPELYSGESVLRHPAPYPASCRPQAWSAASAAAIITAVLGLEIDVPGRRVTVRPATGAPFGAMRVEGLRFAGETFCLAVDAAGDVSVSGLPDDVTFEVR